MHNRSDVRAALLLAAVVVLMILSGYVKADEWRAADTWREASFQTLNYIDWRQTSYIVDHADEGYYESQSAWLIGEHPTQVGVDNMMAGAAVLHAVAAYYLPHGWREAFQYITIGGKLQATVNNYAIGIRVPF